MLTLVGHLVSALKSAIKHSQLIQRLNHLPAVVRRTSVRRSHQRIGTENLEQMKITLEMIQDQVCRVEVPAVVLGANPERSHSHKSIPSKHIQPLTPRLLSNQRVQIQLRLRRSSQPKNGHRRSRRRYFLDRRTLRRDLQAEHILALGLVGGPRLVHLRAKALMSARLLAPLAAMKVQTSYCLWVQERCHLQKPTPILRQSPD